MNASCYGFSISSELDLSFLREGGGDPLAVFRMDREPVTSGQQLIVEFKPTPRNPMRAKLYAQPDPGVFDLEIDGEDGFHIDTIAGTIGVVAGTEPVRTEERLWGFPSLLSFLARGDVPLHGASVEVDGRGILLCAPGRHGKTTLAAAFHRAGHRLLSEDLSCVRLKGRPAILPGPASLRVRLDVVDALELTDIEPLLLDGERVHFSIAAHRRGPSQPVPLAAIILLKGEGRRFELERVSPVDAIRDLWFLSFNFPDANDRQRCFTDLSTLCSLVPVWDLSRPMRIDALEETVGNLASLVGASA